MNRRSFSVDSDKISTGFSSEHKNHRVQKLVPDIFTFSRRNGKRAKVLRKNICTIQPPSFSHDKSTLQSLCARRTFGRYRIFHHAYKQHKSSICHRVNGSILWPLSEWQQMDRISSLTRCKNVILSAKITTNSLVRVLHWKSEGRHTYPAEAGGVLISHCVKLWTELLTFRREQKATLTSCLVHSQIQHHFAPSELSTVLRKTNEKRCVPATHTASHRKCRMSMTQMCE